MFLMQSVQLIIQDIEESEIEDTIEGKSLDSNGYLNMKIMIILLKKYG